MNTTPENPASVSPAIFGEGFDFANRVLNVTTTGGSYAAMLATIKAMADEYAAQVASAKDAEILRMAKLLDAVSVICENTPELNLSNFSVDQAETLNASSIEIHGLLYPITCEYRKKGLV